MAQLRRLSVVLVALLGVVAFGACSDTPTAVRASAPTFKYGSERTGDYLVLGINGSLPAGIGERLVAAGSTIVRDYSEVGLIVARANTSGFAQRAAAIAGVESVTEDRMIDFTDPNMRVVEFDGIEGMATEVPTGDPIVAFIDSSMRVVGVDFDGIDGAVTGRVASLADDDPLYPLQWAPAAINAPEAWNASYTGAGVRVAILDGGIFNAHPDLRDNVDADASRSFVPGFAFNTDVGTFWHGTHVAGIVAAVDNRTGVIGIAPNATLIGVKVLHNEKGLVSWLIAGVLYAATPQSEGGGGAQIINMSVGLLIEDAKAKDDKKDIKELTKALDRAMSYAWTRGVTVIAAAGNEAINLDVAKRAISIPAQSQHVISVAATGPIGWALGNREFARLASYSNWGKSVVDLSAPGGDFAYPGTEFCTVLVRNPCWVFDMYLSTSRGSATSVGNYTWAAGTSMSSPVTAGVAALIIQKAGGNISPTQVEAELRRGALDLGQPGNDAVYGHGWVNAFGSVR